MTVRPTTSSPHASQPAYGRRPTYRSVLQTGNGTADDFDAEGIGPTAREFETRRNAVLETAARPASNAMVKHVTALLDSPADFVRNEQLLFVVTRTSPR